MKPPIKITATITTALALLAGPAFVAPAINASPVAQEVGVSVPTESAEAAWWHFTVRKWGGRCNYAWLGGKRYEVMRWAYSWASDYPKCQRTGKTVTIHR